MNKHSFDDALHASAPTVAISVAARERLEEMSREAGARKVPHARRTGLIIGAVGVAVIALTAGAVVTYLPVTYEAKASIDFVYPTNPFDQPTPTGAIVNCTAYVTFDRFTSTEQVDEVESFVKTRDWSDLGERIQARAATIQVAQNGELPEPQRQADEQVESFTQAIYVELQHIAAAELPSVGRLSGYRSTCVTETD